jgi:hypothetical protein
MLTRDEHVKRLQAFEVDRLLKLVDLEARKHHDGHWTLLSFTTGYKVAFGTPDMQSYGQPSDGYHELQSMPAATTVKDALIVALVEHKTFAEYYEAKGPPWWYTTPHPDEEEWAPIPALPGLKWLEKRANFPPTREGLLLCPVCQFEYTHLALCFVNQLGETVLITGTGVRQDTLGGASWHGSIIKIQAYCEYGHQFQITLQFHKGSVCVSHQRLNDCETAHTEELRRR